MAKSASKQTTAPDKKLNDLAPDIETAEGQFMTTDQGLKINDDQNSLKAGERGGTLLEDFILREKITHFDHERIPERIVHARGSAAHGFFQVYESMAKYTKAGFLQDPSVKTPVFTRFSTVAGFRGSGDLARDVRGFSVKFYTDEGNYDLVGNNIPVFFIQDAIKFPDLIHAVKPEPHNEIPQAASAHDTFWDFISLLPESMHMIMWAMSDRAIPRSLRMMEGFGVHTFRFIDAQGKGCFVKFHWKPLLGVHSVTWDEALKINGKDPDFHRRDLYDAIESGAFPEWEFGVQIIAEKDEHYFPFDILDPTKLIPEEVIPVTRIGKMTLNRNPDNFFAETEQVAFHPGHLVPGIDFSNDPLLQGRLFSYTDTQLSRLGSPNFHEIPINRSINTIHNNQRDGHMRQQINQGKVAYNPNSLAGGCPFQAKMADGGFTSYAERIDANKVRARSKSFHDHFSQARLFYMSQSKPEQNHIVDALSFELGHCDTEAIRVRVVGLLTQIDGELASRVANNLGIKVPAKPEQPINHSFGADTKPKDVQPVFVQQNVETSPALSMANTIKNSIKTRQVAILATNGADDSLMKMKAALATQGAVVKIVSLTLGTFKTAAGETVKADQAFLGSSSVLFDAIFIPGGAASVNALKAKPEAILFINETYRHCKAIAATGEAVDLLSSTFAGEKINGEGDNSLTSLGVVTAQNFDQKVATSFINAIAQHRFWAREDMSKVPA
ncbi:MAG: catalase [Bacteroidota bacterium]|nr:catalase [Bacteroidota bacterium]